MTPRAITTAITFALTIGTPALAQDWAGRYAGVEIGYVTGNNDNSWVATPGGVAVDVEGASIGLLYGRNWQSGASVFGYETDLSASNADGFTIGGVTPCITVGEACSNDLDAVATVRARYGMALSNGLMPYVTAGLAVGKVSATADTGACASAICELDETRFGYAVGFGLEGPLNDTWTMRAQGLYMDFGDSRLDGSAPANNVRAEFEYTKVSFGILRKF